MRTTLTLEPDVEEMLRDEAHRSRRSFKAVVNDAIRKGLAGGSVEEKSAPYRIQTRRMGLNSGIDPAKLQSISDELDADDFLAKTKRLTGQDRSE